MVEWWGGGGSDSNCCGDREGEGDALSLVMLVL